MTARPSTSGRFRSATCRRWGDVSALGRAARIEAPKFFFARLARRAARERVPPLPVRRDVHPTEVKVCCVPVGTPEPCLASESLPRAPGEAKPARRRGRRGVEASLALCPSFFRAAEQREAPALFDDLTECGCLTGAQAVARFPWCAEEKAVRAGVFARMLDLLPRERSVAAWSCIVCELYAVMLEDLSPAFRRARADSLAQLGSALSFVPRRGRYGWRRRARWAGLRVTK